MSKRNKRQVVATRWEEKEEKGRVVKANFRDERYIADPVQAKNAAQQEFINALEDESIACVVFVAPAGVGKSYITMSILTDWFKKGTINKIILSRPAVGMKKTLGLLKGGLREKYEPYLLPLVNVICDRYGDGFYENCLNNKTIEMLPLEYVRGRNIVDAIVVDEFQNCEPDDAYTMLTRIADGGKLVLIGDPTQTDIQGENAMEWVPKFLKRHPELAQYVKVIVATSDDIVRGGLCKMVVKAKESEKL